MKTAPRREIHVPVYWLIVGLAVMVLSPVLSILVSVKINQRTIEQNEAAKAQARVESVARYCRLLSSQIDVYADAQTPVGKDAYRTWLTEYQTQGCEPPRK
jgi:hypothetical protein